MVRLTYLVATLALCAAAFTASAEALVPVKRVNPKYPPEAARNGTQGFVDVEFVVDPTGKVTSVSVVGAKPARTFESSAVAAVKQWQFAPGGGRGKVRLDFNL